MIAIICIAVRMKSTRLPKKALKPLYGKPLLERLIERLKKAQIPKNIIICTSTNAQDDPIYNLGVKLNVAVIRGSELDVMSRFLSAAEHNEADHVIRVTGDNPLTDPELIDSMLSHHITTKSSYTYTKDAPKGVKPEIISITALRWLYPRITHDKTEYMTYQLMELHNKTEYKSGIGSENVRLTVDTQEDYEKISAVYDNYSGNPPELLKILDYLNQ